MNRGTFWMVPMAALGLLVGCGGDATPADVAAQACDSQVRTQLGAKPYTLDLKMLAETMTDDGRGSFLLASQFTVDAGLASETVQLLECTVRMGADNTSAEVLNVRFIW